MPTVTTMSGEIVSIDLETRDFEGFVNDALDLATTIAPDWTDRSEFDLGVTLTELFGFMADNLSYYQDRIGGEALFPSAYQRRSIIEHCKLIGYELHPNVSASVDLTIVTTGAGTIPANTQVEVDASDGSPAITFELESDFVSGGAGTFTGIVAIHRTTISETLGSSDGTSNQQFQLEQTPLTTNPDGSSSLAVYVAEGGPPVLWTEVDNFLESEATDTHYRIEIDEDDIVTIIFGDGVNGKVPASGVDNITATYGIGGGRTGNEVGKNRVTSLVGTFDFVSSVTNPDKPSGGMDRETKEEAKVNGPASLRAMDRCVTHKDYIAAALRVSGVSKANAYQGDGVYQERVVIAASGSNPVPSGSWDPYTETGSGLLGGVGDYIKVRKTTPVILYIVPVVVADVYIDATVYLEQNVRRAVAQRYVEDALTAAFDPESFTLGDQVALSYLSDVLEDVSGVRYIDVNRFQRYPTVRLVTEGATSDISFGGFILASEVPRQKWTIEFTGATNFFVSGDSLGLQIGTGTIGVAYTTDDGYFTFLITAGATPPSTGNRWSITVGPTSGNIDPEQDEICRLKDDTFTVALSGGVL